MALAYDATANGLALGSTSLTYSHTCTGSNLILLVTAIVSSGTTVTGITYNTVAMTQITTVTHPTNSSVLYLFYLIAPATGAHDVVVSVSTGDNIRSVSASYTGAKQSAQPDASGTGTQTSSTTITDSITTIADNCWVIAATTNDVDVASNNTNYTNRGNSAGVGMGDSGAVVTPAGALSQTVETSGSANWGIIQASIAPYGTNHTKSLTETITISEPSFLRAFTKAPTETITITDTLSRAFTRAFTESALTVTSRLFGQRKRNSTMTQESTESGSWTRES